jgi:hypothetical protein
MFQFRQDLSSLHLIAFFECDDVDSTGRAGSDSRLSTGFEITCGDDQCVRRSALLNFDRFQPDFDPVLHDVRHPRGVLADQIFRQPAVSRSVWVRKPPANDQRQDENPNPLPPRTSALLGNRSLDSQ